MLRAPAPFLGALFGLMLSSCSLFGGSYELDVVGTDLEQIEMLYVIVDPLDSIAKTAEGDLASLIGSSKQADYLTFAQFEPVQDGPSWSWKLVSVPSEEALVEIEAEEDEPILHVQVASDDLLEAHKQATLVLLANLVDQSWRWKVVPASQLGAAGEMSLQLGPAGFKLHGSK